MIDRKYLSINDAIEMIGCDLEAFRQALIEKETPVYVELDNSVMKWAAGKFDSEADEIAQKHGKGRDGDLEWRAAELSPTPANFVPEDVYVLSGWARVDRDSAFRALRSQNAYATRFVVSLPETALQLILESRLSFNSGDFVSALEAGSFRNHVRFDQLMLRREDAKLMVPDTTTSSRENPADEALAHKPDWAFWNNKALVRVDDAVVLSCDIDPAWHADRLDIIEVRKRKAIVDSHLEAATLPARAPVIKNSNYAGDFLISLSEFRKWGESLDTPFGFPAQYPKAAVSSSPENTIVIPTEPLCVSSNLALLNKASAKFWANADRDDRGTHPTNDDVSKWLVEQGMSKTLADKAASIVRPEWAPTGRRPEE